MDKDGSGIACLDDVVVKSGSEPVRGMPGIVNSLLDDLKNWDERTFDHSVNVGLYGLRFARWFSENPEDMFYAFILHDIGKLRIDQKVLQKKILDGPEEEIIKLHPLYSYEILKEVHPFYAEVAVRHHTFQNGSSYPKSLPPLPKDFNEDMINMVERYVLSLAVLDSYDSMTTREFDSEIHDNKTVMVNDNKDAAYHTNEHFPITPEEAKERLESKFSSYEDQFVRFYGMHVKDFIDTVYNNVVLKGRISSQRQN